MAMMLKLVKLKVTSWLASWLEQLPVFIYGYHAALTPFVFIDRHLALLVQFYSTANNREITLTPINYHRPSFIKISLDKISIKMNIIKKSNKVKIFYLTLYLFPSHKPFIYSSIIFSIHEIIIKSFFFLIKLQLKWEMNKWKWK